MSSPKQKAKELTDKYIKYTHVKLFMKVEDKAELNLQDLAKELAEAEQVLQWLTDNTKNTCQKRFMRSKIRIIKKIIKDL